MLKFVQKIGPASDAFAIFIDEKLEFASGGQYLTTKSIAKLKSFIKKKKQKKIDTISSFDLDEELKCFLIKIDKKNNQENFEDLGGEFFSHLRNFKNINKIDLCIDSFRENKKDIIRLGVEFANGFNLKSYVFEKYKTVKKKNKLNLEINLLTKFKKEILDKYKYYESIQKGVFLTRDLVSEPPNILNPKKYVQEIKKLKNLGLKINIYNETKLKKMGMNALLGVGKGSINESFLVTIEWKGTKNQNKPLAFVGKGVCFDTGGISLKPARFMEEMKYDMAGSAVVVGLLKTLALRKAKVNVIGIVGLVENMPGGNAQRPGDIVKSYSGKTIEVLNTDAEGRLVLADALTFAEKKYNPQFIIDLATLTGAIIISLGEEYAGAFSNDDKLSNQVINSGKKVNEKVWRLPLHKNYDKLINSNVADVQNINYSGGAGSITAAQFLKRFILKNTPWLHLDIAGMAFSKKAANLNPSGATGFGVRLLNHLIKENYEK